jgi:mRNA-degrading endonuclease toxin of MazEF toxin-antitoxin module
MRVRRGDIVSADLDGPNDDDTRGAEIYKIRPAVVTQNDAGNKHSVTTIIAPNSSVTWTTTGATLW